ncbi:MAG: hypothetical protein WAW41_02065 [Methylobacter sp.]
MPSPKVKSPAFDSFKNIQSLAIAIGGKDVTNNSKFKHLGLLYRQDNGTIQLMHMGWLLTDTLTKVDPNSDYCWIPCENIDPTVLDNVADWLETIWSVNNGKLPYSVSDYDAEPFDASGNLIIKSSYEGFTCSTFVLWVFHQAQLNLINKNTWQFREDDKKWQTHVINLNKRKNKNKKAEEHFKAQLDNPKLGYRIRPEEVAGVAAIYSDAPIEFSQAVELGELVLEGMNVLHKL